MKDAREPAREFLREKFSPDTEHRMIHLDFESLAALLTEYEESLPPMIGNCREYYG